jgi:hypothetical protein
MNRSDCLFGILFGMMSAAVPVAMAVEQSPAGKNLCILYKQNCPDHPATYQETIQEMIRNLQTEIDKGTAVYTEEELKILNSKLRFEEEVWDLING